MFSLFRQWTISCHFKIIVVLFQMGFMIDGFRSGGEGPTGSNFHYILAHLSICQIGYSKSGKNTRCTKLILIYFSLFRLPTIFKRYNNTCPANQIKLLQFVSRCNWSWFNVRKASSHEAFFVLKMLNHAQKNQRIISHFSQRNWAGDLPQKIRISPCPSPHSWDKEMSGGQPSPPDQASFFQQLAWWVASGIIFLLSFLACIPFLATPDWGRQA